MDENSRKAKAQQKLCYDCNARSREFDPNDQVLVLLTSTSKFLAQWQGPYRVIRRIGSVDYKIDMGDHHRRYGIFHVNMLKKWCVPVVTSYFGDEGTEEADDIITWRDEADEEELVINKELTVQRKLELQELLEKYDATLQSTPGKTLTEHRIDVGQSQPVRLPPYCLPHAYRETVKAELHNMEECGVIEPSSSEWASAVVSVKKKQWFQSLLR